MQQDSLSRGIKEGDMQAFRTVYEQHYKMLVGFAYNILGDMGLAEEIVDDAIFYLWEHREELEIKQSIRAYLFTVVKNKSINEIKSASHRAFSGFKNISEEENLDFLESVFVDSKHPLGTLIQKESELRVKFYVDMLPDETRRVFVKSRVDGMTYQQIADELGISINTVKYHMKNALSILRKNLEPYMQAIVLAVFIGGKFI